MSKLINKELKKCPKCHKDTTEGHVTTAIKRRGYKYLCTSCFDKVNLFSLEFVKMING